MSQNYTPLFQRTVFKEFVAKQDHKKIQAAYQKFADHFGDSAIQANILKAKEEQYQEGFLTDFFVNILDYTLFPQEKYNLLTEKKIGETTQKADAVIEKNEKIHAIIELKGANTTDLRKVIAQAFGYKSHYPECRMVITSNFTDLRFYIDHSATHEEYTLFDRHTGEILPYERFAELYTILHKNNLLSGLPLTLKEKSELREQELTLAFYNDYQAAKAAFYKNMALNNRKTDKLLLFEKAQKLLDRLVFVCFAQYKGLLPVNHVVTIIKEWETLKKLGESQALYQRFRKHFGYIDQGFVGELYEIFAYNGGLFAQDEILEKIQIDDSVLEMHCRILTKYNFRDDIDVNILGHIFEHSLNELEEKREELVNEKTPNTKRKEDGIFYTPILITNYMLEESLGKMCLDKQKEVGFESLNLEKIQKYRDWLLGLRILDPSCGSGAFLNQVLTFLLKEHAHLSHLEKGFVKKFKEKEYAYQILENNIFGVDINAESVEITKLSLWLRIAEGKRKLNDLSENIKMGNSLIDDKNIDPKAFDWKKQFPKTVEGFDLILGNPPYGAYLRENRKKYLEKNYDFVPDFESYYYFISKGLNLLKADGKISMIVPNTFLANHFAQNYRKNLLEEHTILALVDLSELAIFDEAKVRNCIFLFRKQKSEVLTKFSTYSQDEKKVNTDKYLNESYLAENMSNWLTLFSISKEIYAVIKKIRNSGKVLNDFSIVSQGYIPYRRSDLIKNYGEEGNKIVDERLWHSEKRLSQEYKQEILGRDVQRYAHTERELYIRYTKEVASYVDPKFFTSPRILVREIAEDLLVCSYFEKEYYTNSSIISIISRNYELDLKYILALLNSKLVGWYHHNTSPKAKKGLFPKILVKDVRNIPIPEVSLSEQQPFIEKVNQILDLKQQLHKIQTDLLEMLESELGASKFTRKLENWYKLDWNEFSDQLDKSKIETSLKEKKQWKDFFKEEQPKAKKIFDKAQTLENELDTMIFSLYGLTEEERKMLEGN